MHRILIVDDDTRALSLFRSVLERHWYAVREASSRAGALASLRKTSTNPVIIDIVMHGGEGIETMMDVSREFPNVGVIATAGGGKLAAACHLDIARKLGAVSTLAKPVGDQELLRDVRGALTMD